MSRPRLLRSPALQRIGSRGLVAVLLITAVIGALGSVAFSPLVVEHIGLVDDKQWQRFSNIGQTYGAASAILSVLALIGVAVSLIMQSRESKASREQARRALHFELLKMAMDDPFYLHVWGPFAPSDTDLYREHMYASLILSHWQMDWDVGTLDEEHLREIASVFFQGEVGQRIWRDTRDLRMRAERRHRRRMRFLRALDEEWQAVSAKSATDSAESPLSEPPSETAGEPGDPTVDARKVPADAARWMAIGALGAGALAVGATAIRALHHRRP